MQKATKIIVKGKVQNVGFRFYTKKKAIELGLNGFVKNKLDGSVYIEAMGESESMDAFIIWCYSGPQWAKVKGVQLSNMPLFESDGFIIK